MSLGAVVTQQHGLHEAYPIADYVDGMKLDKEPWLSPRNAFRVLDDGRVFRGRLEKRTGFTRFAELAQDDSDLSVFAAFITANQFFYFHAADDTQIIPESATFRSDNGTAGAPFINAHVDASSEQWTGTVEAGDFQDTFPVTFATNSWFYDVVDSSDPTIVLGVFVRASFPSAPVAGSYARFFWNLHSGYVGDPTDNGEMFYRRTSQEDVMGLHRLRVGAGNFAVAFDTGRCYEYDATLGFYQPQGKGGVYTDYMTADNTNYVWSWATDTDLIFTNGVDEVFKWSPTDAEASSVTEIGTAWDGGGNELDTALIVLQWRNRLVYLNTTESATVFNTRARWTAAGTTESFDSPAPFADAPTSLGAIVTAAFIGDRLFVGFEDGWMEFVSTGDTNAPFAWEPYISRFGSVAKLSTIQDNERLLTRSQTTMQGLDYNGQFYIDQNIPDFMQNVGPDSTELSAAVRNEEQRSFWWLYTSVGATRPEFILNATYDENNELSWSRYTNMLFNVFSNFTSDSTPTWNSMGPSTWNDFTGTTWNSASTGATDFIEIIGGGERGMVYRFDTSTTDGLVYSTQRNITLIAETERLTPFPGQRAHLGWVDVYADGSTGATLQIFFYSDSSTASYRTVEIDLTPNSGQSKIYKRVSVGKVASWHRMKFESTSDRAVKIDAIIPWMRPAGRLRTFS
jgi:hypothetical protein